MKILFLCLCFLLCGCQTSFEKDNMNLKQLKESLYSYFEFPLSEDEKLIQEPLRTQLNKVEDKLILVTPFSYPNEMIIIVHDDNDKWMSFFQDYVKQLKSSNTYIETNQYYEKCVKIGKIHQYTYFIMSKNHQKIIDYLLGM